MPIIESAYRPINPLFRNTHFNTIYASLLRWIPRIKFTRERIVVDQVDFLDLDWSRVGSKKLILVLAGLEGKSRSRYSKAAIRHYNNQGWDAVCMNYRGCSGEENKLLQGYHMGGSSDVKETVNHILANYDYQEIVLLGYSLGGNLALKYAGEESENLPRQVRACISYSVPLDLKKSNERLSRWYNWHYLKWFMFPLNRKANKKKRQYPEQISTYKGFFMSKDFLYFDTHFTAPANGYSTVEEYWTKSSSKPLLKNINIPTLIIASKDDTFISANCYPYREAEGNEMITLEISDKGGHCGFIRKFFEKVWWMEERAYEFCQSIK